MKKKLIKQAVILSLAAVAGFSSVPTILQKVSGQSTVVQADYTQQEFLDQIGPSSQQIATDHGLYPSVMIAQAMLESNFGNSTLAAAPNYNLFGIKGTFNGQSVSLKTQEWNNDTSEYDTITAEFRKYPDLYTSLADYASLLRNGLSWNPSYYNGTWLENTNSYADATAWLTGRYATAPGYDTKLNSLVMQYNLTKYDPQENKSKGIVQVVYPTKAQDKYAGPKNNNSNNLTVGSLWRYDRSFKLYNGISWFEVGKDQWVSNQYVKDLGNYDPSKPVAKTGVVKVNYQTGTQIYTKANSQATDRNLDNGTQWRFFEVATINGVTWYDLGNNQWVSGATVQEV